MLDFFVKNNNFFKIVVIEIRMLCIFYLFINLLLCGENVV